MDVILYKLRPYICLAVAAYALSMGKLTPLTMTCAGTLLFCGLYIFMLRSKKRQLVQGDASRNPNMRDMNKPKTYHINM